MRRIVSVFVPSVRPWPFDSRVIAAGLIATVALAANFVPWLLGGTVLLFAILGLRLYRHLPLITLSLVAGGFVYVGVDIVWYQYLINTALCFAPLMYALATGKHAC